MNVFRLDNDPNIAALYHCDKHVVKMNTESAQLLSAAHVVLDGPVRDDIYKPSKSQTMHPCAVWARESHENYLWLHALGMALCRQYTARYRRVHATEQILARLAEPPHNIRQGAETPAPLCMPERYHGPDVVHAYRLCYVGEKLRFARWRYNEPPPWLDEYLSHLDKLWDTTELNA